MPAGLGGAGWLAIIFEATMGTYLAPTEVGTVWVPILDESLAYQEDKYYSPQIRQQTIVSEQKQSYYSVAGDVRLQAGSAAITAGSSGAKTASITVVRNGIGFGYAGCVLGGYSFSVEEGVLIMTMNILGLSEETPGGLGSPAWTDPEIFGADAHSIYLDTAGVAPAFAGAVETNFHGFEFSVDFNAEAQNRIRADREASYIRY